MRRLFVFLMEVAGFVPSAELEHSEARGRQLVAEIETLESANHELHKGVARLRGDNVALRKSYRGLVEQYESLRASFQDKLRQARRERLMRAVEVPEPPDQLLEKIKRDIPPLAVAVLALVLIFLVVNPAVAGPWGAARRIQPLCSGEFKLGVLAVTTAVCDWDEFEATFAHCDKYETWLYDECRNLISYSCEIYSGCAPCPLSCDEPAPEPDQPDPLLLEDYQQAP